MDTVEKEIIKNIHTMQKEDKNKVLLFVRGLKDTDSIKNTHSNLKEFKSLINESDLDIIEKSIQDDCERIDANEW